VKVRVGSTLLSLDGRMREESAKKTEGRIEGRVGEENGRKD
jgi:hypothetical protein